MTYLFFDTETTGLPDLKKPTSWEGQPHICQLGAIVTYDEGRVKAEANLLIKPEGWTIPEAASAIHGISHTDAENYGLPVKTALAIFSRLAAMSSMAVAHNAQFDFFFLDVECARLGVSITLPARRTCTMQDSRDVLCLPPTQKMAACGMTDFKSPNLQEAFRYFFGRDFEGAHDAMADVRACRDVFFALQRAKNANSAGAAA